MKIDKFLEIVNLFEKLKTHTRHAYHANGTKETVAGHSWRISAMAYFLKDEFPEADINKVILMCVMHDIGEIFTGDIPVFRKTEADEVEEKNRIDEFIASLPSPYDKDLKELFLEMEENVTLESKIYKALDRVEAMIQHNESPLNTWDINEYKFSQTYAEDKMGFSDYFEALRERIAEISIEKMGKENVEKYLK